MSRIIAMFLLSTLYTTFVMADELVVIKAVSQSKKTFVVGKGVSDGVHVGQKRAFTTDKISLIARVIETKPNLSLWEIDETNSTVPFKSNEVVMQTSTTDSIWTDIARIEKDFKKISDKYYENDHVTSFLVSKLAFSKGLNETTSDISADQSVNRTGFQFEALYTHIFPWSQFEFGIGGRYDRDNILVNSEFTIASTRLLGLFDIQYNFEESRKLGGNFYVGAQAGYGTSSSTVQTTNSSGTANVLPCLRLGFRQNFESYHILYELASESLSVNEKFADGSVQKTTLINNKFNIGIRF